MDSAGWLAHFRSNRMRPEPRLPARVDDLSPPLRAPLVASLQRFQLGETGDGTIARQIAACADPAVDARIVECVELWIREEGRHARELAELLRVLGARPISRHFSQAAFKSARRAFGVHTKLATIFVAEVVGLVFYGLVADRAESAAIAEVAATLCGDESAHLDFLLALMRAMVGARRGVARAWLATHFVGLGSAILAGAFVTIAIDQRATFRALGTNGMSFAARGVFEVVRRLVRPGAPPPARQAIERRDASDLAAVA